MVKRVKKDLVVLEATMEKQVLEEKMVRLDLRAQQDKKVRLVRLENRVRLVKLEHKV